MLVTAPVRSTRDGNVFSLCVCPPAEYPLVKSLAQSRVGVLLPSLAPGGTTLNGTRTGYPLSPRKGHPSPSPDRTRTRGLLVFRNFDSIRAIRRANFTQPCNRVPLTTYVFALLEERGTPGLVARFGEKIPKTSTPQDRDYPFPQQDHTFIRYAAGATPLALTQEDFLVLVE